MPSRIPSQPMTSFARLTLAVAFLAAAFAARSPAARAADEERSPFEVLYVSQKGAYAVINGGSREGLGEGDEVCFFPEDDDVSPVACGPVIRTKRTVSAVLVGEQDIDRIQIGMMTGRNKAAKKSKKKKTRKWDDEFDKNLDDSLLQAEDLVGDAPKATKKAKPEAARGADAYFLYTPLLPFAYSMPAFNIYTRIAGAGALWLNDKTVKSSQAGFGFGYAYAIPDTANTFNPNFYVRVLPGDRHDVDFDPTSQQVYSRGKTLVSDYGVNLDAWESLVESKRFRANLVLGLGLDSSTMSFDATTVDERAGTRETAASVTSNLFLGMLRGGVAVDGLFGSLRVGARLIGLLPIIAQQNLTKKADRLPNDVPGKERSMDDLKDAMGHQKRAFGLEATVNVGMEF